MSRHSRRAAFALQTLAEQDPALGVLALWCTHRDDDAAVLAAETRGQTIWYGPAFEALPRHQQVGLAAHHVMHVAFCHAARAQGLRLRLGDVFDGDVYTIAADALINDTLFLAGYALPRPCIELHDLLSQIDEAAGPDALAHWDADSLYIRLMHGRPGTQDRKGAGDRAREIREMAERKGHARDLSPDGTPEEAGAPDSDTDWRQRLSRAMAEGRRAGRGVGALGFRLGDLPEVRTPWEVQLRAMATKAVMDHPRLSWHRPTRRWLAQDDHARRTDGSVPAFQSVTVRDRVVPRIAVGIDMSGSVDDTRLGLFAAQIAAIGRRLTAEVHVLAFDVDVRSHRIMQGLSWEAEISAIDFARGGGTSFEAVIAAAVALNPSIIVVLTDLDGPFGPAPRGVPVIWAVPGPARQPPFGRVLDLTA